MYREVVSLYKELIHDRNRFRIVIENARTDTNSWREYEEVLGIKEEQEETCLKLCMAI